MQIVVLGSLLWSGGLPKGVDVNASLIAGYASENNSWGELWDDSRSPGSPKHITRLTSTELAVTWLTDLTGNVEASTRFMAWLLRTAAPLMMYAFFFAVTRSRSGAVAAGLIYFFARGAALYSGLPLAAGFALLPLWLLALDRSLIQPRLQIALLFGVVSAALLTATVPGFAYLTLLVGIVYVLSFAIARLATSKNLRQTCSELMVSVRTLLIGSAIALSLSAYFIFAIWLSTIPLIDQSGGYELGDLAARLPLLSDAAALQPVGFTQGPLWLDAVSNALIVFVGLAAAIAFNFRIGAFLVIYFVAILFASDVTSSTYTFLFDNVPYFSLVRGAGRWIGLATLSIAFMSGMAVALAISGRSVAAPWIRERFWPTIFPGAMTLAWGSLVMVVIFVSTHISAVREWNTPYSVDPSLIEAFEFVDNIPGNPPFATAPFLATRLSGEPFISAIDFGRTLGPGSTGSSAFGGLRAGGLDINENAAGITETLITPTETFGDIAVFPGQLTELFVAPDNFQLLATLPLVVSDSNPGMLELQFRDRGQNEQVQLNIDLANGVVQVVEGRQQTNLIGAVPFDPEANSITLDIRKIGSSLRLLITPGQSTEVFVPSIAATSVLARTTGGVSELHAVELSEINPLTAISDDVIVRLLDLYRIQYMLVQPHASRIEANRIADIENLTTVEAWGDAELLEIDRRHPGQAYLSENYGIYAGPTSQMVPGLFQVGSLAESLFPVLAFEDASTSSNLDGMVSGATFIAVPNPSASGETELEISNIERMPGRPPLIVLPAVTNDLQDELGSPYLLTNSQFVREPIQLWRTSRNYVFEAEINLPDLLNDATTIQFSNTSVSGQPAETVEISASRVQIIDHSEGLERVLVSGAKRTGSDFQVRINQLGDSLEVYIDQRLVASTTLPQSSATGPFTVSSVRQGFNLTNIALATNREGHEFLDTVANNGFSVADLVSAGTPPKRDLINLFPALSGQSIILRNLPSTGFRVLARVESNEVKSVGGFITSGSNTMFLEMEHLNDDESDATAWYLSSEIPSETFRDSSMVVFAQGEGADVSTVFLVEDSPEFSTASFAGILLNERTFTPVSLDRNSATFYSGTATVADAKLLVFRDSYNTGWRLKGDGANWEKVRLFGSLSGFWIPAGVDSSPVQIDVQFRSQSTFMWGKVISALSFLALLAFLYWRHRTDRRVKTTISLSQDTA